MENFLTVARKIPGATFKRDPNSCFYPPEDSIGHYMEWGCIDCRTGQLAIKLKYNSLWEFKKNGLAVAKNGINDSLQTSYIIDTTGRVLLIDKFEYINNIGGYFITKKEKFGIIDPHGKIMVAYEFDTIEYQYERHFFLAKKGDKKYLLDLKTGRKHGPFSLDDEFSFIHDHLFSVKEKDSSTLFHYYNDKVKKFLFDSLHNEYINGIDAEFLRINYKNDFFYINLDTGYIYKKE